MRSGDEVTHAKCYSLDLECTPKAHVLKVWSLVPNANWEVTEPLVSGAQHKEVRSLGSMPLKEISGP